VKVYCFDVDGTICSNTDGDYERAIPFIAMIRKIGSLYEKGHKIIMYTARGSTTGIDWYDFTKKQLENWGVKYHELFMGKPYADVYIDDKAINAVEWAAQEDNKGI